MKPHNHLLPVVAVWAALFLATTYVWAADPTTADCLSANDNSIALRSQHKLRAARAELLTCAAATCPADIRNECARRVAEVNASMPTIVFEAKDPNGNDLSAVKVSMDGQALVERLEGTALSIDPGEHVFVFESQGLPLVQKQFVIREGEKDRRERVPFGTQPAQVPVGQPGQAAPAPASPNPNGGFFPPPPSPPPQGGADVRSTGGDSHQAKRTIGYIVGIAGLGAIGVGIYEQVTALDRDDHSNTAAASANPGVRGTAHELHEQALQAQTYAIVCGAVGVAAVGTGLFLILSSSKSATPAQTANRGWHVIPALGIAAGSLSVARTW